jgi:hypothetical protein
MATPQKKVLGRGLEALLAQPSEAAARAIESAGIELYGTPYGNPCNATGEVDYSKPCHIGGVGESAIKAALLAIGQALGYSDLVCESF